MDDFLYEAIFIPEGAVAPSNMLFCLILILLTMRISIINEEKQIWRTVCTKPMTKKIYVYTLCNI